jgi:tetratricopeptide (TPR) repeat protein
LEPGVSKFDGRIYVFPRTSTVLLIADILCGAIPFVLILSLSLFAVKKITTKVSPVAVVMLAFYASFLFAFACTYNSHILSGFFALAGYVFIKKKKYSLAGLMVGFALAIEFPVGILLPVWALVIFLNEKKFSKPILFALGAIPGLLIVMYLNYLLTGSITKTPYNYELREVKQNAQDVGFYFPSFSALWGLVFSLYRGLIIYTPVLILMAWYGIKYGYENTIKEVKNKLELVSMGMKNYLLITVIAYLLLYSAYYQWDGGWTFGPRYLIPMVIIVLFEGISFLLSKQFSSYFFYALTGAGLLFIWMDKSTKMYQIPEGSALYGNPTADIIIPDFLSHKFNAGTLPVFLFDMNPVISIYAWPVLFFAGLIILTIWYSRLYPARKSKINIYIPVACLTLIYAILIIPGYGESRGKLALNYTGAFGEWQEHTLANNNLANAQTSQDPAQRAQYYSQALEESKKGIELFKFDPDCYYNLGFCYLVEGMQDSAVLAFKKTIELDPKYDRAENLLGTIYLNKSQFDSAVRYFIMSYNANPENPDALMKIGAAYQNERNYALAFHYDSLVLKSDPGNKPTLNALSLMHNEYGIQYLNNNGLDQALKEFQLALKCDSNSANILANIGIAYQKKGEAGKAKIYFQKALAKDPNNEAIKKNLR